MRTLRFSAGLPSLRPADRRPLRTAIVPLLAAAFVVAALAELGLRTVIGLGTPPLMQKDAEVGYVFRADQDLWRFGNQVKINRYHQRSADITPLPAPGVLRTLVIGDSITFGGVQVNQDQPFPAVLEARLRVANMPAEVLNASAGSWAIGNELAYVQKFGVFGSQVTVLEIGSDDLVQKTSVSDPVGVDPDYPDHTPPAALVELFHRYLIPRLVGKAAASPPSINSNDLQFLQNMEELSQEVALLRKLGTQVVIVHLPTRDEVVAEGGSFSPYYASYRARFRNIADRLEIPVIDLSVEWKGLPAAAGFYRDGTHLSVLGDQVVGERLARQVEALAAAPAGKEQSTR